jgi:hypothetical protein
MFIDSEVQAARQSTVLSLVILDGLGTYFSVQEIVMMTNICSFTNCIISGL